MQVKQRKHEEDREREGVKKQWQGKEERTTERETKGKRHFV